MLQSVTEETYFVTILICVAFGMQECYPGSVVVHASTLCELLIGDEWEATLREDMGNDITVGQQGSHFRPKVFVQIYTINIECCITLLRQYV
jgi:hypothetical protein